MPAGPSDPLTEFGAPCHRRAPDLGTTLDLVDEGAELLGLGPALGLLLEKPPTLLLLAPALLGFERLASGLHACRASRSRVRRWARLTSATITRPSTTSFRVCSSGRF